MYVLIPIFYHALFVNADLPLYYLEAIYESLFLNAL